MLCLSVSFARITKGIDATLFLEAFVRKPALFGLLHFIELFPDSARAQRRVLLMVRSFIHLLLFTSSHLHIFSSSHLLIFTSSHLHICTCSHLHISSSSHLGICTSSHLLCVSLSLARSLAFFLFLSSGAGAGQTMQVLFSAVSSLEKLQVTVAEAAHKHGLGKSLKKLVDDDQMSAPLQTLAERQMQAWMAVIKTRSQ